MEKTAAAASSSNLPNSSLHFCTLCGVALNSETQLAAHESGSRHRLRLSRHSPSSDSSSPVIFAESGYTSASGGDDLALIREQSPDLEVPPALIANSVNNRSLQEIIDLEDELNELHITGGVEKSCSGDVGP